jgi:hypothetical protein
MLKVNCEEERGVPFSKHFSEGGFQFQNVWLGCLNMDFSTKNALSEGKCYRREMNVSKSFFQNF